MTLRRRALGVVACAVACTFNSEGSGASASDDGSGSSSSSPGTDSTPTTLSTTTLPTTGPGDDTTASSSDASETSDPPDTTGSPTDDTGEAPGLVGDDALVVRYWLDQAASGPLDMPILDAGPGTPMDLTPVYSPGQAQPDWVEDDGHRGLRWNQHGSGGRGEIALAGTKLAALDGTTSVTLEIVAELTSVFRTAEPWARLVVWQPDVQAYGIEMGILGAWHDDAFALDVRAAWSPGSGDPIARWSLSEHPGRFVAHLVVDTSDPPSSFLRMYLDGSEVEAVFNGEGPPDTAIEVGAESFLVLGNRPNDNGSFGGAIYYFAIYDRPLDSDEIAHNAARLSRDDDAP